MSSGRAGVVVPVGFIPLLPGDSCSGRIGIDVALKEMPKPLLNAVTANFQAWFVPKSAHPRYSGRDELLHSMSGDVIKALGASDRTPPPFFDLITGGTNVPMFRDSPMAKILGLHIPSGSSLNSDVVDAFNLVWNFRAAAHSSAIQRRRYAAENLALALNLPPAFWPSSRFSRVVPDYERALVVGSLDLDVVAGRLPVSGIGWKGVGGTPAGVGDVIRQTTGNDTASAGEWYGLNANAYGLSDGAAAASAIPQIFAEMAGSSIGITLADIDKARTTQAFAKLRTAYAGNDTTGFDNDDTLVSLLMQGISVPPDEFKRPWLLDSKRVPVNFAQRYASDGANRLCCTNRVRDSSRESSVIAGPHEQTDTPDLQDPELASLQRGAQAPGLADDLVRSCHDLGCRADRQARPPARLQ